MFNKEGSGPNTYLIANKKTRIRTGYCLEDSKILLDVNHGYIHDNSIIVHSVQVQQTHPINSSCLSFQQSYFSEMFC